MTPTERARRAAGLDGMRGVASLCVFLVHIWIYTNPSRPPRDDFWDFLVFELRLSVVFFFVLSGFLLFRDFARAAVRQDGPADARGYGIRRVARIAPAYYVALAGAVALLWGGDIAGFRPISLGDLGVFALFGQNYTEGTQLRFNPVLWTLALEVAFYITLPFIGMLAYRLGNVRRVALMLASTVPLGIAWNAFVYYDEQSSVVAYLLPSYLPYFALGMLLSLGLEYQMAHRGRRPELGAWAAAGVMAGGLALVVLNGWWHATELEPTTNASIGLFQDLPAAFGFTAMIAASAFGGGALVAWTRFRPFVYAGVVSYGFYLWHVPLILFVKRLGLLPENFFAAAAVTLPLALAVAAASWHLMEKPVIEWAARRHRARRGVAQRARLEARTAP
jgi:peptidoglycan/LPS O-acetylase OafA/YrhL